MTTKYFETKEQYLAFRQAWKDAINNKTHHMTAAHFMLYNIIRGKDPQHGFTPFQRHSKMEGMGYINLGAYMTWSELSSLQANKWYADARERFLAPFGDTFTEEDFAKLEIPKVTPVASNFGKGKQIFDRIVNGEIKPTTAEELMSYYNEEDKEAA